MGAHLDIADWLNGIGLGRYAREFLDHDVDASLLPRLTSADLREIGVSSVGHRRLILTEAASLADGGATMARAERRQLTVMFCDLVGSSAISERLDPEDMTDVVSAYHYCCADIISEHGGAVVDFLGDGVMASFGYPRARENDAEQAVMAGLALLREIPRLETKVGSELVARVGIDSGRVVVGQIGAAASRERPSIVGDAPNRASRIQAQADPGQLLLSDATRKLCRQSFEFEDHGLHAFKGFGEEVRLWHPAIPARRTVSAGPSDPSLVGRRQEMAELGRRWDEAKRECGQVVLLEGEAGLGKSRLLRAFRGHLGGTPHTVLSFRGSPSFQSTAYHAITDYLGRALGSFDHEAPTTRKLRRLLGLGRAGDEDFVERLAALVDGQPPAYRTREFDPAAFRDWLFDVVVRRLSVAAKSAPVLLLLDDAQWADPSSQDLFHRLVGWIGERRVMLVAATRPGGWPDRQATADAHRITLAPLSVSEARRVVREVAGEVEVPDPLIERIVERSDGVPVYVEELTRAALERMRGRAPKNAHEAVESVPSTLADTIVARIDALGPAKELVLVASCIGVDFPFRILRRVSDAGEQETRRALAQLTRARLIFRRRGDGDETYSFRHKLMQEAAYELLLLTDRRRLHALIADVLQGPEGGGAPELIARHYELAEMAERAASQWFRVGETQIGVGGYVEAIRALEHARGQIRSAEIRSDRLIRLELRILAARGAALIAIGPQSSPEIRAAYEEAFAVSRTVGATPETAPVLFGLAVHFFFRGQLARAETMCRQLIRLAEELQDPRLESGARLMLNQIHFWRGELDEVHGVDDQETGDASQEAARQMARYAQDPLITSRITHVWALNLSARFDEAAREAEVAIARARQLNHPYSLSQAHQIRCWLHQVRGEAEHCLEAASDFRAVAEKHGFVLLLDIADIHLAWARGDLGQISDGAEQIDGIVGRWVEKGSHLGVNAATALLADLALGQGMHELGLSAVDRALADGRSEDVVYRPELMRLRGKLLSASGAAPEEARAHLIEARSAASRMGLRLIALRAGTDLVDLSRRLGQGVPAQEMDQLRGLVAAATGFAESLRDWRAARAVLEASEGRDR